MKATDREILLHVRRSNRVGKTLVKTAKKQTKSFQHEKCLHILFTCVHEHTEQLFEIFGFLKYAN